MLEIVDIERVAPEPIIRMRVEMQIESETIDGRCEFYKTREEMKQAREKFEREHKRPDGSWIPNIDYVEFEEEVVSLDDAKEDMTVAQFEELYGVKVEDLL